MIKTIEEALARSAGKSPVFERSLTCLIEKTDRGALAISRLTDRYHDIALAILVDPRSFEIKEAGVKLIKAPYSMCKETEAGVASLSGLSIYHRAVNREVRKRIRRRDGCTHIFELIEFTLASLFSGAPLAGMGGEGSPDALGDEDPEEHRKRNLSNPWLKNTCYAFRTDNGTNGTEEE